MTREELLKKIDFEKSWLYDCGIFGSDVDIAFHAIKKSVIEALEQEPKTGHWVKYGIPRCGEQHYKCTSCGYYINFGQWGELYSKEFKYCPNCGCRMAESEE